MVVDLFSMTSWTQIVAGKPNVNNSLKGGGGLEIKIEVT